MATQITITLPDETYLRAQRFARLANRDLASLLADTVIGSLPPMSEKIDNLEAIVLLTDDQIIALTELQMDFTQDQRLSELLNEQQARILTDAEKQELESLMQIYQEGLLRKATALSEAVKRGLMEPLQA
jgi:hypothetical protein